MTHSPPDDFTNVDAQCAWDNEGGAVHNAAATTRLPQDTSEGCLAMAADDLARQEAADTPWARSRMKQSSAVWTSRARSLAARGR